MLSTKVWLRRDETQSSNTVARCVSPSVSIFWNVGKLLCSVYTVYRLLSVDMSSYSILNINKYINMTIYVIGLVLWSLTAAPIFDMKNF